MGVVAMGDLNLRAEEISSITTGFALQSYILKDSLTISPSNSWKETYFVEDAADLTNTSSPVKGIPRGAKFPFGKVKFDPQSRRHEKYGMEGMIFWEDEVTSDIDVIGRTLLRIGRAVAKAVDDEIYSQVSSNAGNSVTIAAGNEWDATTIANRDPIDNILEAEELIATDNYDPYSNGELWLSPKDFRNLLSNPNVRNAGQFWTKDPTKRGRVGMLASLTVKVSNSVSADEAIVMIAKESGTWKEAHALTVHTTVDPGVKKVIRAWQVGTTQITNPNAICKISNTQE